MSDRPDLKGTSLNLVTFMEVLEENIFSMCAEAEMKEEIFFSILGVREGYAGILKVALMISDENQRQEFLNHCLKVCSGLFLIASKVSVVFPETATEAQRLHMKRVRPKKDQNEEKKIASVIAGWNPALVTLFKFSLGAASDLNKQGVKISPKALRDRMKLTVVK